MRIRVPVAPVLLTLCSLVIALLLLEVAARIIDGVPLLKAENFVALALDAMHTEGISVYDPQTGWVQKPNVKRGKGSLIYTTGELGVRMSSAAVRPLAAGSILVVGDSFAGGAEVSDASAWPAQLERMVDRTVINAAVGGFSLDQTVLRAEELVPRLRPKFLLVEIVPLFSLNVSYSMFGGAPKPYFTLEDGSLVRHNDPVPRHASSVGDIGWLRGIFGYSYLVHFTMIRLNALQWWVTGLLNYKREYSVEEASEVCCLLLNRLAKLRQQYDLQIGLVVQYGGADGEQRSALPWYGEKIDQCAQVQGFDFVDDFKVLRAVVTEQGIDAYRRLWIMHENDRAYGHMSEEGNHVIAALVAEKFFGSLGARAQ